ncbi:MAG: threonylcarbamoyl-AMP synthase [Leptospiraceae bacterium]|nr:threonylcarbamoyl-AMP synthase [Leptospiraceae bacterium]
MHLDQACKALRSGELVAIPTETVYGLAADATNPAAVARIFAAKERPAFNPLIVHLGNQEQLHRYAAVHPLVDRLAVFWPGPLSILLPRRSTIPDIVTAGSDLCAFRIPDHPLTLQLLQQLRLPLAAPSANISNQRSPTNAAMVTAQLSNRIAGVLDGGQCAVGLESTVVQIIADNTVQILRPGAIGCVELIAQGIQCVAFRPSGLDASAESDRLLAAAPQMAGPRQQGLLSPGQLRRHYSPAVPLILLPEPGLWQASVWDQVRTILQDQQWHRLAVLDFGNSQIAATLGRNMEGRPISITASQNLSSRGDLIEAGAALFGSFDALAANGRPDAIIACKVADKNIGIAINDRLHRASSFEPA